MKQSISSDTAPDSGERLARQRGHADRGVAKRREAHIAQQQRRDARLAAILDDATAHPGRGHARLVAAVEQVRTALAFSATGETQ